MRWVILCLFLAGCGSRLADEDARQACHGFPEGSPAYASCYAQVYESSRANHLAASSSMSNTMIWGGTVLMNQ